LDIVYEKAKEVRNQQAEKLISSVFGPNIDMDKVKKFFSKDSGESKTDDQPKQDDLKAAFVPPSAGGSRSGDIKNRDWNAEIKKAQDAGDVSKVVDLVFRKQGAIK
jgi:hypothetical protein